MSIHLMLFTASPHEPGPDTMLGLMDNYGHLQIKGKELTGGFSAWNIGMVGKKTTRNGAIKGYYWRAAFKEVSSADMLVVFDDTITSTERKRFINQLVDRYKGHVEKQALDLAGFYRHSGFDLHLLEQDYPLDPTAAT